MGLTVYLLGASTASGILFTSGIIELFVSLFFISHLHPLHLILQAIAGICALISGVMGVVFSGKFSGSRRPTRTGGMRVALVVNCIVHTIALTFLLLDKAGYATFLKKMFPDNVIPQWTHTRALLSKGILALSCANSMAMFMSMLIWVCALSCFMLHERNVSSNITITSARWVWKSNETTTFKSPGSTISFGIPPKKSKWRTDEPNAAPESSCDIPDCRPKRKFSFKSYTAKNFKDRTSRTSFCRMSSFRPTKESSRMENQITCNNSNESQLDSSTNSVISNFSTIPRRTPMKILLPTAPPLVSTPYVKPPYENYVSPDYVPYKPNPLQGLRGEVKGCCETPNYVPHVPMIAFHKD